MIRFENECVGCHTNMGCMGSSCPYMHVPYFVCDKCGDEVEMLYDTCDGQLCEKCAGENKEDYTVIDEDNVMQFASYEEEDDVYDYADLAYEQMRDERWEEEHG